MATPPTPPSIPIVLAGFDDVSPQERGKLRFDLYKVRVEEFRGRYESMRELEWKILFQMYAGYAAIAVIYEHLKGSSVPILTSCVAIGATVVFYIAARVLTYRIEERLIVFDSIRLRYLTEMHTLLGTKEIPWQNRLGNTYHWSYHTQLRLSTLVCLSLVGYEATRGLTKFWPIATEISITAAVGLVTYVSLRFGWKVRR
jgi:hypothetical protein